MKLRDYQLKAVAATKEAWKLHQRTLLVMATGVGKCLGKGTQVLTYGGRVVSVEDVQVGDWLIGPDSNPRRVESLARGREMMYRITPRKGDSYAVNESHILSFRKTQVRNSTFPCHQGGGVVNVSVREYLEKSKTWKHVHKGWRSPVEFMPPIVPIKIDPYFLGLWLGDGSSRSPSITTGDDEILDAVYECAKRELLSVRIEPNSENSVIAHISLGRKPGRGHTSPLLRKLQHYDLILNKHIPADYKRSSRKERLQLLAGMMDSDGHLNDGVYDLVLKSEVLMNDVVFLARSLGFAAYPVPCRKTCTNNGVTGDYWRCNISGETSDIPCRIPRKQASKRLQKKNVLNVGITVDPIGIDDYFGFEISGPDRLFLLGDFTVTHNTVVFSTLAKDRVELGKVLVVAHRTELLEQAGNKIEAIAGQQPAVEKAMRTHDDNISMFGDTTQDIIVASVPTLNAMNRSASVPVATQVEEIVDGEIFVKTKEILKCSKCLGDGCDSCYDGTAYRMCKFDPNEFSTLIIDEAHHATAMTYRRIIEWFCRNKDLKVLGVTATPDRTDEAALGQIFDGVAFEYQITDAIQGGWLVPIEQAFVSIDSIDLSSVSTRMGDLAEGEVAAIIEEEENIHGIVDGTRQHAGDKKTMFFFPSVAAAHMAAEILNRHEPGCAAALDGTTDKEIRKETIRQFADGEIQYLANCGLFLEGFDEPTIEVIAQARPTKSRSLAAQIIGRGTRALPGVVDGLANAAARKQAIAESAKPRVTILDFVGYAGKHELVSTGDLLGGDYTQEEIEHAVAEIRQNGAADMSEQLETARAALEERARQQAAEAERRAGIIMSANIRITKADPFNILNIQPTQATRSASKKPTARQKTSLENIGVPKSEIAKLGYSTASQLLDEISSRRSDNLCSYKQAKILSQNGLPTDVDFKMATRIITRIAKENWKLKPETRKTIISFLNSKQPAGV